MDDIYQISNTLENSDLTGTERKEILDKLKINLMEIQDEIDSKDSEFNFRLSNKITKYKKLLDQISEEITENENSYQLEKHDYMFPDTINDLNKKLNEKIVELETKRELKNKKKIELNNLINEKIELQHKYDKNKQIINSKKKKIENNLEITALIEKKNKLIGNKKKNFLDMNKKLENEEKKTKNFINSQKKELESKSKKLNYQIESTNKLLLKTINSLRKINSTSKECQIKNKEVESLNKVINNLNDSLEKEKNSFKIQEQEEYKKLEDFKNNLKKEIESENNKIDEIIIMIDGRFYELNNYFIDLKQTNLDIIKKMNKLEKNILKSEKDIFSINLEHVIQEKNILEKTISLNQDKSCQKFMTFKNVYDDKIDDLVNKKNKLINKINTLTNLKNNDINYVELVNTKNYIYRILNGNN